MKVKGGKKGIRPAAAIRAASAVRKGWKKQQNKEQAKRRRRGVCFCNGRIVAKISLRTLWGFSEASTQGHGHWRDKEVFGGAAKGCVSEDIAEDLDGTRPAGQYFELFWQHRPAGFAKHPMAEQHVPAGQQGAQEAATEKHLCGDPRSGWQHRPAGSR